MDSGKQVSFTEAIGSHGFFVLYGNLISNLPGDGFGRIASPAMTQFARVRAYRVGDFCVRLPQPVVLLVPGNGETPEQGDTCARSGEVMWQVLPSDRSLALTSSIGTIGDILDDVSSKGVSGGLQLDNPRIQNGQACVDIHAWAKIEIFGAKVGFDERFPVCIPLEGCHTVYDLGWARVEVCFRAPNQVCAKLCVGKWGIEKCWDYCVSVNLAAAQSAMRGSDCGCAH